MVLIFIDFFVVFVEDSVVFPSPYGDYGSYLKSPLRHWQKRRNKFPSPYGDYGSYLGRLVKRTASRHYWSFRPLTGIMVLINYEIHDKRKFCRCFRPLTGIMVLIRTPYKWLHSAIENAFCGADFLFSSFFTFLWKMIFKNCPIAGF